MEMGASTGMMQQLQLNKRLRLSHHTGDKSHWTLPNPTESRAIPPPKFWLVFSDFGHPRAHAEGDVSLGLGFYLSWIRRTGTSQVNNGLEGYYGAMNCHVTIDI